MNREEFMQQLARLLSDLPENERMEAIRYYNDYFDEAGPENEAKVISELGSPGKVAAIIKADLKENDGAGETSKDTQSDRWRNAQDSMPGNYSPVHKSRGAGRWALIIILVVFLSPVILGIGSGVFGVFVGILAAIFGIWVSIFTAGAGLLGGGIALLAKGVIRLFSAPASGLVSMGGGFLSIALGIFILIFFFWFTFRFLPRLCRTVVNFISRLLHKRKGAAAS